MSQQSEVDKAAPRGERARIEQLIASQSAKVRRAFRRFLDDVRSTAVRRQVRLALEARGVEAALRVVDAHVVRMGTVFTQVFQAAAQSEAEALARQVGAQRAGIAVGFDPSNPRAALLMRQNRLDFVREFTRSQRESTRVALEEALKTGAGPTQTANMFSDSIGLTAYQRQVVANYRRALESGDAAALNRDLRDRRFDASVARAVEQDAPLGAQRIQRMVERYRTRYIQLRAETIARTETLAVVGLARQEALAQVVEQAAIPLTRVKRIWRATQDKRTRDTHSEMDGQEQGSGMPFISPAGAKLMFPGDRSLGAPASEVINCRCVLLTRITRP